MAYKWNGQCLGIWRHSIDPDQTELLTDIGFRFHSFEDVYYECDFDEMFTKLLDYQQEFQTFQIPKKYEPDPELGAWVTMLRRLKRTDDLPVDQVSKFLSDTGAIEISLHDKEDDH